MKNPKTIILILVLIAIAGSIFYIESTKPSRQQIVETPTLPTLRQDVEIKTGERIERKTTEYELAKEITTPDGFINTDSITIQEFIGKKVVLVDFWTYSCINCQRTLPYLNAWHEKYRDEGLVIVGIHTPEFEFEKKYDNVLAAVKKFGVQYSVVLDNDYSTWTAYRNRYWPRKYLIDIDGFIVYDHIGEGGYDETERKIQAALAERVAVLGTQEEISKKIITPEGVETTVSRSPEFYFGAEGNEYLGNGQSGIIGIQAFVEPTEITPNILYLAGEWEFTPEFAENKSAGAKIILHYGAQKVFLVAGSERGINIQVFRDGKVIRVEAGNDILLENGQAIVKDERLYRLIDDPGGYGEHTLEIIIEDPGLRVFAFTFG